jgi:hypothetical protein
MGRTHATLMKTLGADGKLVADQLGHTLRRESERVHAIAGRKQGSDRQPTREFAGRIVLKQCSE